MEVTTARILDKRRMLKKSNTYRLAIRVTFDRKPVPFPLDLYLSEENFKKLSSPRLGKELSEIREKFFLEEQRAKDIIRSLGTFTFQAFRQEFYKQKLSEKSRRYYARLNLQTWLIGNGFFDGLDEEVLEEAYVILSAIAAIFKVSWEIRNVIPFLFGRHAEETREKIFLFPPQVW